MQLSVFGPYLTNWFGKTAYSGAGNSRLGIRVAPLPFTKEELHKYMTDILTAAGHEIVSDPLSKIPRLAFWIAIRDETATSEGPGSELKGFDIWLTYQEPTRSRFLRKLRYEEIPVVSQARAWYSYGGREDLFESLSLMVDDLVNWLPTRDRAPAT